MRQLNQGGVQATHYDTDYLMRGTNKMYQPNTGLVSLGGVFLDMVMTSTGFTDPTIERDCIVYDPGAEFRVYAAVGLAIVNDTDGSSGLITSIVSDDEIRCTLTGGSNNTFERGDQYSIYKTSAYGSKISTHWTDRRFGRKVTGKDTLVNGLFPDDVDLDEYEDNVFGPGQPHRT